MKRMQKICAAVMALALIMMAAGCGGSPTASAGPTASPVPRPDVTAAPGRVPAPQAGSYGGWALKLKPARGDEVIFKDPSAVQLVMDAWATKRLQVEKAEGKFDNKLTVLSADGKAKYSFTMSSDGQLLLKTQDGLVFRMPEYVYYMFENSLWPFDASLMDDLVKWQPDKGTAQLELDLPRLLKAAMLPAFGYSLAYFTTYKIYGVNTATRNTAKVYMLVTIAGYDINRRSFAPEFFYTSPMTLIFTTTGGDEWKLTALKQPALTALQPVETPTPPPGTTTQPAETATAPAATAKMEVVSLKGQALYDSIRLIFPFDYMEAVLEDMNAKTSQLDDMSKDIVRQATEYLNETGINGLTVES